MKAIAKHVGSNVIGGMAIGPEGADGVALPLLAAAE